jgi:hypothetical protein
MHAIVRATALLLALPFAPPLVAVGAAQGSPPARQESTNPACTLLTGEELSTAAGRHYGKGTPGDELGEGLGGGASCQWGGADFFPGEDPPMVSVVFIPAATGGSYTERQLGRKPIGKCTRETLRGIGELAFMEFCERDRGPAIYAKTGRNDILVQVDSEKDKPLGPARAAAIAIAKAVAPKARDR